jgi:hypothetical protein
MISFISKILNLIKYGQVTHSIIDNKKYPITQISCLGKTANAQVISPYGLCINLPKNAKVINFSVGGQEENRACIGFCQDERFKNLLEGEVVVGSPKFSTYIKFSKDGNIEILSTKDINIKASNVNIDAEKTNLGVGGNQIARLGDSVMVTVEGTPYYGTITSSGVNTSI